MTTALVALGSGIVGTLVGASVGFFLRAAEFRRDQRLRVYGEYIAAFLAIGHEGAGAASLYMSFGDTLWKDNRDKLDVVWPALTGALQEFEHATARLRLVASNDALAAADSLETFVNDNVRSVPPLRMSSLSEWGPAAQGGPAIIDSETVRLARQFADIASADVSPRRPPRVGRRQRSART